MEVEAIAGEVKYSLTVPNLSSYDEESHLDAEFSLSLGGLRSRWRVSIQPFLTIKPNKPHDLSSDIGITLSCLRSSISRPDIDIYCSVAGRGEEHEKKLEQVRGKENERAIPLTWRGVMVPRLALRVFDLLPHDQLTATLRFVVRTDDVWRSADPLEELSAHLGELRKGKHSDLNIITSDGVTIPAHSVILRTRSHLLRELPCEAECSSNTHEEHATPQTPNHPQTEKNRPETPLDSIFWSDLSLSGHSSSVSSQESTSSPARPGSPHGVDRVTSAAPALGDLGVVSSPRRPFATSRLTGEKRLLSPCKSPSKQPTASGTQSSPRRKIPHRENETPRRQGSPLPPVSCHSVHSSTSTSYSPFHKYPIKEKGSLQQKSAESATGHTLFVNMSASVTKAMLDWMYTGVCSELECLAKPLLAGGQRHGVGGLVRTCEQHLAATLTPATAPHTLLLAHKYSADSLRLATMKYAVTQAKEVTSQPSWAAVATRAPALMTEFSRLLALHVCPSRKR